MQWPWTTRRIAYRKVAGCTLALVPSIAWFCIGALMNPDAVFNMINGILSGEGILGVTLAVSQFISLLHLIAFLSLVLKRGALLLAIVIWVLSMQFILMFAGFFMVILFSPETLMLGLLAGTAVLIVFLHGMILRRLDAAAGAE